ncbi:MAG: flagellin lysine-N-methylase [Lachnospiraceae bacterium]|nr:flagellin lysine-N-methylase [Lachnospiraceae bacterium]
MEFIFPDYYKNFMCIGGNCPDTCCAGWQIMIDDKSLKNYKNEESSFKNCLYNGIDWKEGCFKQYKKNCVFLNEDKLCDIYIELGKNKLCKTCKTYPRHIEEFEGVREVSLSMSCPVVAKLILTKKDYVHYYKKQKETIEEEYDDFDYLLFTKLEDTREVMIHILQNRTINSCVRIAIFLGFAHDIQRRIRMDEMFSIDSLVDRYTNKGIFSCIEKKMGAYQGCLKESYKFSKDCIWLLQQLEIREIEWKDWIDLCKHTLDSMDLDNYHEKKASFYRQHILGKEERLQWEIYREQILVYFLFTYYCGAVYDNRVYAKVKISIISLYIIEEMLFIQWLLKKEKIKESDWIRFSYKYSRELEHSDINLNQIEEILSKKEEFSLKNFLYGICANYF